jgi:hypothetical protein
MGWCWSSPISPTGCGATPPGALDHRGSRGPPGGRALLAALHQPPTAVIAAAAASSALSGTYRPLQAAVLPWLVRTPAELAASNSVTAVMENCEVLIGPLLPAAHNRRCPCIAPRVFTTYHRALSTTQDWRSVQQCSLRSSGCLHSSACRINGARIDSAPIYGALALDQHYIFRH